MPLLDNVARQSGSKKQTPKSEEYHQPGDVDIIYAKNGQIEDGKNQKRQNYHDKKKENVQNTTEIDGDADNEDSTQQQQKITTFFIKEIHRKILKMHEKEEG